MKIFKRFIAIALICIMTTLCACSNMDMGYGNYRFEHIHISTPQKSVCATVESWLDGEVGIEVKTEEYGSLYCSEGTYILIKSEDDCPFC